MSVVGGSAAKAYANSHVGRRENNEDAYCIASHLGLYAVADGMGGYEGGEIASRLVLDALIDALAEPEERVTAEAERTRLDFAIRAAHDRVVTKALGELEDMGATLAALWLREDHALIAHVGDSRIYRLRAGRLVQLTRDHSLYAELEAQGKRAALEALRGRIEHMVTRCIAADCDARAEIAVDHVQPGDLYLLCSDGLTDALENEDIEKVLVENDPETAIDVLVHRALRAGGRDNITVVVLGIPIA